ncbi:MFS transporter [Piscinibacter sp. XHJ-5]|uniref:MFS transporter n=1 Tax=Piscinibacter sp. XHJ-5 TaxID=3037797 RepID=UPI002452A937|nr:MFS transporter [Piscinibacter sp. XHJ-5]
MSPALPPSSRARSPWPLLLCAGAVLGFALGTRHVQGLFMLPMLGDRGWGRESFAFAAGLQTLVWGVMQPLTGWVADRFGTARVIAWGAAVYAAGLLVESIAPTPGVLAVGAGVVIGAALSATTFATVYGGLARIVAPHRRGWAQGMAGGIGGFVQFLLVPFAQWGIGHVGWSQALQGLALLALACAWAGGRVDDRAAAPAGSGPPAHAVGASPAVRAALRHSGFWLLNLGFISCGFQLAFLGVHLPAYLRDAGMSVQAGVNAIALIALVNAVGTFVCGKLGDLYRRKYLLSALYAVRTLAMIGFLALPIGPASLYAFALVMGATWLGTVPLTSGVVAQIFGVRFLGTLFGLVFLGHQLGGFLGAWLGGSIYDATRSYAWMWAISIGLGVASVLLNLPIRDRSIERQLEPVAA